MPNWNESELRVSGPIEDVVRFVETSCVAPDATEPDLFARVAAEDDMEDKMELIEPALPGFRLSGCLPTPQELLDAPAPFEGSDEERERLVSLYGHADWYSWRAENWGTKWDIDAEDDDPVTVFFPPEEVDDDIIMFSLGFTTPWAGPLAWCERVSTMFPSLLFQIVSQDQLTAVDHDEAPCVGFSNGEVFHGVGFD